MRIRTAVATVGIALAGAAVATTASAGSAAAFKPLSDPGNGLYVGVVLDQGETKAVSNSPIAGALDTLMPADRVYYVLDPKTGLPFDDNYIYANVSDVLAEAAARNGVVAIAVVDAATNDGAPFAVVEKLPR